MEEAVITTYQNYEPRYNSEEVNAVRDFFDKNPTIELTDAQKLEFLEVVADGCGDGTSWDTGTGEYGDGHSFCDIYYIESSPIKIGLDMTYSSWDSSYFNGSVGIVEYTTKSFQVPSFKKL